MDWSSAQRSRLMSEKIAMREILPQFSFCDSGSSTPAYVAGWERPSGGHHEYYLCLMLSSLFPLDVSPLYVVRPVTLPRYGGGWVPASSEAFHTRESSCEGHLQICYCRRDAWDPSISVTGVMFRGLLWVHMYEQHLRTGKTVDDLYKELRRTIGNGGLYYV